MAVESKTNARQSPFHTCEACGVRVRVENLANHRTRVHPRQTFEPPPSETRAGPQGPRPRSSRSWARPLAFLLAVVIVASSVALLLYEKAEQGQPVEPGAIRMEVSMSGFSPNALSVRSGDNVRINLINLDNSFHSDGGGQHNFMIPELGVNILVQPEGQMAFSVPATSPGTYTWYCDICCGGKDNPAMLGTLTVAA